MDIFVWGASNRSGFSGDWNQEETKLHHEILKFFILPGTCIWILRLGARRERLRWLLAQRSRLLPPKNPRGEALQSCELVVEDLASVMARRPLIKAGEEDLLMFAVRGSALLLFQAHLLPPDLF
ncbi:hypothetical protein NC653_018522 [Populus alba x Populus x berolinensis]|uniref:Uncharacterized protein n=1 Tax=Populus alba x Populus x berolinensis TaxID=444605 RepID=A0AAD6QGL4_9ROSI|nr:hypothetical protein NC653_018522 [Populus alba x Populus x berolinensis]